MLITMALLTECGARFWQSYIKRTARKYRSNTLRLNVYEQDKPETEKLIIQKSQQRFSTKTDSFLMVVLTFGRQFEGVGTT